MSFFQKVIFVLLGSATLLSCGGGGGGGTTANNQPQVSEQPTVFQAAKYQGAYLDICQLLDSATNLTTNKPLYYQFYKEVAATTSATALYTWRLHLYDTPDCSGGVVGLVQNLSSANQFTVVGQANIAGKLVDQVVIKIGGLNGSAISSLIRQQGQQVLLEGAFQLSLPSDLLSGGELGELLLLENGKLFYGNEDYAASGFPKAIDTSLYATKLTSAMGIPDAPCAGGGVGWQTSVPLSCGSSLSPATSGSIVSVTHRADIFGSANKGSAKFQCVNGKWSGPLEATCETTFTFCPVETKTWTINGLTCSGTVNENSSSRVPGDYVILGSSNPRGTGRFLCTQSGQWALDTTSPFSSLNSCEPAPPPPPPITDPLQLATSKNCMVCHGVDTTLIGPSFKTVADRYRNNPPAPGLLEGRIKNGVVGIYSATPMPANPQVSDADLAIILPWILSR